MKSLEQLTRPNIWNLKPYSCARNEFTASDEESPYVFLDANENPYGVHSSIGENQNCFLNRYPDPLQLELKARLAKIKGVQPQQIFLGNGSDEAIDLIYRCFTVPEVDNVVAIQPTYGMYQVCADINNVEYRNVPLDDNYQLSAQKLLNACDEHTKVIWICSPNNPTGNSLDQQEITTVLQQFDGLVVIDEAYSDFSSQKPFRQQLSHFPNLIVLNTFSKAWASAAIRLGMAFADPQIINIFNKVKYPYNISLLTQQQAMVALKEPYQVQEWVKLILQERSRVIQSIQQLKLCEKVYPTDANFFLVKVANAQLLYDYLLKEQIIVRNRNQVTKCLNCLRITVGTKTENNRLIAALRQFQERPYFQSGC